MELPFFHFLHVLYQVLRQLLQLAPLFKKEKVGVQLEVVVNWGGQDFMGRNPRNPNHSYPYCIRFVGLNVFFLNN